ncbi:MAG: dethiobiotin synthase [Thiohalocapsa sp. PB-PSB1]|jgi:dethiobiotin synthetase|nr:MAG: hypothetical protein N838_01380 [Thiohalocapsa sp. PB-PSB1]QQO56578.1 MAG: dethiobiotin synthase [Thiohalocapsa sp. PB-PSB1]HCS91281.1 dethiobiotin synthase [Chromatiaceae bacterium]
MSGVFVTGTDTDAGKTEICLGLMAALQQQGLSVLGMKPVASGGSLCPDHLIDNRPGQPALCCEDALRLQSQGSRQVRYETVNPYAFDPPIAPHLAAAEVGVQIELEVLRTAYAELTGQADFVVVEGVGGWRVPLAPRLAVSDLPMALDLPVLLVVGLRLGCINHALLTAEAIRARGACLIGWVANLVDPNMLAPDRNIATLSAEIDAPMLGSVPWLDRMEPNIIGAHLRVDSLVQQKPREA